MLEKLFGDSESMPDIAVSSGPTDPASETGDFVLPNDPPSTPIQQMIAELREIIEIAERVHNRTHNAADLTRLDELVDSACRANEDSQEAQHLHDESDDGAEINVIDLSHEECRIYHFHDGHEVEVKHPLSLSIGLDGSHQITCYDRVGITVRSGWIRIEHYARFGEACFAGHLPVHEIG